MNQPEDKPKLIPRSPDRVKKIKNYARARALGNTKKKSMEIASIPVTTPPVAIENTEVFQVTQKKLVREMERIGVTDALIARRIKDLLTKKQVTLSFGKRVIVSNTDPVAVGKALEHIAKVRGDYEPIQVENANPLAGLSIAQLMGALQKEQVSSELFGELLPEHMPNDPAVGTCQGQ